MAYVSLYRKYRSQTFEDLIGQDHVVRTIQNAINTGRIAHAYLFTGPRGTGKTSSARLLAKCLNCQSFEEPTPTPCNRCEMCVSITDGSALDVAEFDAASEAGVDDVREKIVSVVDYPPMVARYKVFIIDEVHDLSAKAFDALLKTIEEPPPHLVFILATTEAHKVPPTIRSRCQKFEFHRASMQNLRDRLTHVANEEGLEAEPSAINAIARMADGGYRDALTLLEQAMLTEGKAITLQGVYDQLGLVSEEAVDALLESIRAADPAALAEGLDAIAAQGRDPRAIVESMLHRLTDLTRAGYGISEGSDATRDASLHEAAARFGRDNLLALRSELAVTHKTIRDVSLPRLWLEAELTRIAMKLARAGAAPVVAAPAATVTAPVPLVEQTNGTGLKRPSFVRDKEKRIEAPVEPEPEQEPVPGSIQALDEPRDEPLAEPGASGVIPPDPQAVFEATIAAFSDEIKMKPRLLGGQVVHYDTDRLTIALLGIHAKWLAEKEPAKKWLRGELAAAGLPTKTLDVVPKAREMEGAEPNSVELPLEGAALHRAITQTLVNPPSDYEPGARSRAEKPATGAKGAERRGTDNEAS